MSIFPEREFLIIERIDGIKMAVNQPGWHMKFTYRGGNSGAELRLERGPGSGRRSGRSRETRMMDSRQL